MGKKKEKAGQAKSTRGFCSKDDVLQCRGEAYPIKRLVCWARQKEGRAGCRACPERDRQLYLFGSPRQIG